MNKNKLEYLEHKFISVYPDAFDNEELKKHSKKHNINKHFENARKYCSKEYLDQGLYALDDVVKIVTRSTLVSVFEKMRFRDLVKELDVTEKKLIVSSVKELIHGDEEYGFNSLVSLLSPYKLAKWPIITIFRAYYYPHDDIFVKPTTVKKILAFLEVDDMKYTSKVNYDFYRKYRTLFNSLKLYVDKKLSPNNPAFSGFLMLTIE